MGWLLVVIGILRLLGGGSGWFCAGYECFWGDCELIFSCCQWLRVVMGCFWVVIGCNGWL